MAQTLVSEKCFFLRRRRLPGIQVPQQDLLFMDNNANHSSTVCSRNNTSALRIHVAIFFDGWIDISLQPFIFSSSHRDNGHIRDNILEHDLYMYIRGIYKIQSLFI